MRGAVGASQSGELHGGEPQSSGEGGSLQIVEVHCHSKVVKYVWQERGVEEHLWRVRVDVAKQLERVGIGCCLADDGTSLEHQLVRAEVAALEKHELVFVRQVERPLLILHETEMKRLDTRCRRIGARVACREQLGAAEASLHIGGAGGKDGLVAVVEEREKSVNKNRGGSQRL